MRGRIASTVLVGAASVVLVGCGGSDSADAVAPVQTYLRALSSGDGETACAQFSGAYKREFLASYMDGFPELGATTCGEVVDKLSAMLGSDETAALREAEAKSEVEGDRATVTITGGTSAATVQRIDGEWLIVGGLNFQSP